VPTDEEGLDRSLEDVLTAAAEDLEGVSLHDGEWTVAGRTFAAVAAGVAEFHLDPLVARAALRTPDTAASNRGPDWVAFAPGELDDAAIDRAEAWFLSAHRRATHRGPSAG
jgi:hypothetical protein